MIVTVREAAKIARVDPQTIKNWIYRQRIPAIRTPGGHWRLNTDELRKLGFPVEHNNGAIPED